jgi:hypothetical protein
MAQRTFLRFTLVSLIVITHHRIHAQTAFTTGYYQISGGLYTECCGIAGNDFSYELPDQNQRFVELIIDPGGTSARLTFLRPDMFTVFRSPQEPPGFPFSFANGMVFSNYIRFLSPAPLPAWNSWSYTVTNLADRLEINGAAVSSPEGADVPNQFEHANVVATLVPNPTVLDHVARNGTNIQFHFSGRAPYDYTVEFTDSLIKPDWQELATYRAKLQTIDVTVTQPLTNAQSRFFRIRQQPCDCR